MAKNTYIVQCQNNDIQSNNPRDLFNQVAQSNADLTEAYSNIPGGRVSAKKRNYSGGIQRIETTSVPEVNRKYEYKQAIKEMRAEGLKMEDIARKLGISISYAYQFARE